MGIMSNFWSIRGGNYADSWEPEENLRNAQAQLNQFLNDDPGQIGRKARKRKDGD